MPREKDFEKKVKKFLDSLGSEVWYFKHWAGPYSQAGIPDIIACVNNNFVGIEIKAADGKPSALQIRNINRIKAAGGIGYILYPKDFESFKQDINEILKE
ncbi:VRR-NUC domain-containing protein [Clostridium sp.]|uniref:VRR-NUC domain-containing protein n=1 Tax=Clostridium sp. TaxID=1506 RepID=UPI00260188AC|nr:VRR-NUC domain-containing protein [Clostridium sp.]